MCCIEMLHVSSRNPYWNDTLMHIVLTDVSSSSLLATMYYSYCTPDGEHGVDSSALVNISLYASLLSVYFILSADRTVSAWPFESCGKVGLFL